MIVHDIVYDRILVMGTAMELKQNQNVAHIEIKYSGAEHVTLYLGRATVYKSDFLLESCICTNDLRV